MTAPQKQARRTVVYNIRTTVGLVFGIAGLVLAIFSFSPALAANGARRQSNSPVLAAGSINAARGGAILSSPNTSTSPAVLASVACTSGSDCWAVGRQGSITLIEHWDGTTWSIVASPNPEAGYDELNGVTCVTASDCWAVGRAATQAPQRILIEHWDGISWTVTPSPNADITNNALASVSCSSASQCWAVGFYDVGRYTKTLIERWDGFSWTVVSSPNVANSNDNILVSATCTSATNCWAVGYYNSGGPTKTLIERWNGTAWAIVSSPNATALDYNILGSVACVSSSDCYAVGYYLQASPEAERTLIEHWNGSTWSIVTSANTTSIEDNELSAVSCTSSADCWAIGAFAGTTRASALIEHWNGSAWAVVAAPTTNWPYDNHRVFKVNCISTPDCWAVGTDDNQTVTEHWDGTIWSICPNLQITGITQASDGVSWTFSIDGHGFGVTHIDIQATSDLTQPFVTIGSTTLDLNRRFHYDDSGPVGAQPRFYRASIP
jgi:hypothetical protein